MGDPRRPGRSRLATRLLAFYAVAFLVLIGLFGFLVDSSMRSALVDQVTTGLVEKARAVSLVVDRQGGSTVGALGAALGAHITVVAPGGAALADSSGDPAALGNLGDRPEVADAFQGRVGVSHRTSVGSGEDRLFVAVPAAEGRVVRLSVAWAEVSGELAGLRRSVVLLAVAAGALGVLIVALVAELLARPIRRLTDLATEVAGGDLDVVARRSSVAELDRLGLAIERTASEVGSRIRQSEAERHTLEVVLNALPQGVLLLDGDGAFAYVNPAARSLLGSVPTEIRNLAPRRLQRLVRQARDSGSLLVEEIDHGSPARTLRAAVAPLEDDGRVLLVLTDVTERRRVEAMRRDFVADASHELKTPVASILASVEALQLAREHEPGRVADFAGQVETSAHHLARLVGDLLDLSRLEATAPDLHPVALDAIVRSELDRASEGATAGDVELISELEQVEVLGSSADLALAVRNLCDNALRYSEAGGRVTVRVLRQGEEGVVEVTDTGVGIPTRAVPRVFERFYRVDVARARASGGTGLGLAIVKHVAETHGGSVAVESRLGVGSTFRLSIPVSPSANRE